MPGKRKVQRTGRSVGDLGQKEADLEKVSEELEEVSEEQLRHMGGGKSAKAAAVKSEISVSAARDKPSVADHYSGLSAGLLRGLQPPAAPPAPAPFPLPTARLGWIATM
jgi:hypothetical protein